MISAIFDLIGSLASAFFQVAGALDRAFLDILSALSSAVLWPVRAVGNVLFGSWDTSTPWTPLYFLACGILFAAVILLAVWALWTNYKRRHGK